MHKKKYLFLILFFVFCLFANSVFALEVSDYPNIPGLKIPTDGNLPTFIAYFFGFAAYIAGSIAAISFAIGAVQFAMSAASPSAAKSGKERMIGSVIGLFLTVTAVIILRTINPTIVEVNITPLPTTDGVYYTNGSNFIVAPTSEANTANIPKGYGTLTYKCLSGPVLLIWKFPKTNFQGNNENYEGVKVVRKKCGESEPVSDAGSFKWSFETPGIYYCMGTCTNNMCNGYMSAANASSEELPAPFKNNLKSVRIVNDLKTSSRYGIIFHDVDDPTATGTCSKFLYSADTNTEFECFNDISVSASSTVYFWNYKNFSESGQGVDFYSEPFGWAVGARAGKFSVSRNTINNFWTANSSELTLNYSGIERPTAYKNLYKTFQQRAGSIDLKGNYLLALWNDSTCQIFFKDIQNIKSTEFTGMGNTVKKINVIPLK